jgi:hypothetical protein
MPIDELIEVDDNELFLGDQHLKIDSSDLTEKEKKTPEVENESQVDPEDVIEVDDTIFKQPSEEEETFDNTPELEEEEEEEEETDSNNKSEKSDEDISKKSNEFSAFGGLLAEKGFFPDLNEEDISNIEDEEGLSDLLNKQLVTTFRQWQDNYKKNLVRNLTKEGYVSEEAVKDKLPQTYTDDEIKNDIEVAKAVIQRYYKRVGTPDKVIDRTISSMEDIEESAIELNKLNAELDAKEDNALAEKLKKQEEQALIQREQFNETLKKNTFEYEEFIPGRKLRTKDKEEVFMNIEPTLSKINSNLGKYAPLLSYLDKYGILEGNFDKLIKEGASKQTTKFAKILQEKSRKSTGTTHRKKDENSLDLDNGDIPQLYK